MEMVSRCWVDKEYYALPKLVDQLLLVLVLHGLDVQGHRLQAWQRPFTTHIRLYFQGINLTVIAPKNV